MPKNSASKCPTPNANCGITCATVAWAGANSAVKNRLVRMWAISSVTSQNWWWKPTAGNISNRPLMMPNAAAISSRAAKASCASGTTTSCNAPRRYWKPSCANGKNWTGIERGMLWEAAALAAALSGSTLDEASVTPSPQPLSRTSRELFQSQGERGLNMSSTILGKANLASRDSQREAATKIQMCTGLSPSPSGTGTARAKCERGVGVRASSLDFPHSAESSIRKSPFLVLRTSNTCPSGTGTVHAKCERGVGVRASNQNKTPRPHHFAHKASHPCKIRRVFLTHF